MKSTLTYVLVVVTFALAGVGYFAWQEYQQLIVARVAARGVKDVAAVEKRAWDAEQQSLRLQAQLTAAESKAAVATTVAPDRGTAAAAPADAAAIQAAFQGVFGDAQFLSSQETLAKAQLDVRYASLLRTLNLTPDQTEALKTLLVDRLTALQNAQTAAEAAGLDPRSAGQVYQKFLSDALTTYNDQIQSLAGDTALAAVKQYDATNTQRTLVAQLQQQLAQIDSKALLNETQTEALVNILATNPPSRNRGPGSDVGAQISGTALTQAETVLTPAQLQALQNLQQSQAAQSTINGMLTAARGISSL